MLSKEEIEKIKKGIESATSVEELEDLDSVIDDLLKHTDVEGGKIKVEKEPILSPQKPKLQRQQTPPRPPAPLNPFPPTPPRTLPPVRNPIVMQGRELTEEERRVRGLFGMGLDPDKEKDLRTLLDAMRLIMN